MIFGTSHVGKSTLGGELGETLGWPTLSTDALARHPGRPWPKVPGPVAEYYSRLTDETINWFLRVHHRNMWPLVRRMIDDALREKRPLIFEGTALRPEFIAELTREKVLAIGLHANQTFLRDRMEAESLYFRQDAGARLLIDKFIARSLLDNEKIVETSSRHGLRLVNVANSSDLDRLGEELTDILASSAEPSS